VQQVFTGEMQFLLHGVKALNQRSVNYD